jgi:hypothetical protein
MKKILFMAAMLFTAIAGAQHVLESGQTIAIQDVVICDNEADSSTMLDAMQFRSPVGIADAFIAIQEKGRQEHRTPPCKVQFESLQVRIVGTMREAPVPDLLNPKTITIWYMVAVRLEGDSRTHYLLTRRPVVHPPSGYYRWV